MPKSMVFQPFRCRSKGTKIYNEVPCNHEESSIDGISVRSSFESVGSLRSIQVSDLRGAGTRRKRQNIYIYIYICIDLKVHVRSFI